MALHACINGSLVEQIIDILSEEQYQNLAQQYSTVVLIADMIVPPSVGWFFVGTQFSPPADQQVPLEALIKGTIKKYQDAAPELLRELYTQNTLMGITTQQSDTMFTEYLDVLVRIREGAWPTALYALSQKQPSGFVTQEMIDSWIDLIQSKMT
jgi:hypothetical protein